ncbi:MAG: DarT ssDNA thymidine ADP-ribosyltransferase family protein [Peptostreptococcaceae bacterium]
MDLEIKEFLEERNITRLCHFTKISNLESILNNGLLSLDTLENKGLNYSYNDEQRLEKKRDAICTSITFPNYKMFYKYREIINGGNEEYCVLILDASVLYEKKCLFCITNAASNKEKYRHDYDKMGIKGLKELFYDHDCRQVGLLGLEYATDPQAEVLVLEDIEINYIKSINFISGETDFPWKEFSNMIFYQNEDLFKYRDDYEYWS